MAGRLPILTFHTLEDRPSPISFPPDLFRQMLSLFHNAGYRTIQLRQVAHFLRRGEPFPDRSFVITFDDGYQTVYKDAFPVLQEFRMEALVFLATGKTFPAGDKRLPPICERRMLSGREVEEMSRWGVSFGAHTISHPDLTQVKLTQADLEIQSSKCLIEDALSMPVDAFAYPFGSYNLRVKELTEKHFACACTDALGLVSGKSDPYTMERVETYYFRNPRTLSIVTSDALKSYLAIRNLPRRMRRSVQRWRR